MLNYDPNFIKLDVNPKWRVIIKDLETFRYYESKCGIFNIDYLSECLRNEILNLKLISFNNPSDYINSFKLRAKSLIDIIAKIIANLDSVNSVHKRPLDSYKSYFNYLIEVIRIGESFLLDLDNPEIYVIRNFKDNIKVLSIESIFGNVD